MSDYEKEDFITIQFLSCIPLRDFIWTSHKSFLHKKNCLVHVNLEHSTWSECCQLAILDSTVYHPKAREYPPLQKYQKLFIKLFIKKVESAGETCIEQVYPLYVDFLKEDNEVYSYKSYYLPPAATFLTLRENTQILSQGTTGLVTWTVFLVLAEWCLSNKERLKDLNIIELGSGSGITGLVVSKCIDIKSYTFTDVHPNVLSQLAANIKINKLGTEKHNVRHLNWEDKCSLINKPDVILAADVVFDPSLLPSLVKTIRDLLSLGDGTTCYVASTIRNEQTYQSFLFNLRELRLKYEDLTTENVQKVFVYDKSADVHIIKLFK